MYKRIKGTNGDLQNTRQKTNIEQRFSLFVLFFTYQVLNLLDNGKQLAKNSIDKNMCENKLYHSIFKFNAKNSDLFSIFIPPVIRISQNRILPFLLRYICVSNLISMCELFM
jgi:hypothetical protein